tara:strand:+ start:735 stop:920 length:186 start_codon:yes stop_codon:yes gene_type:complete
MVQENPKPKDKSIKLMPSKVVSLYHGVIADFYNTIYNYKLTKENNLTGGEAFFKKMTCGLS